MLREVAGPRQPCARLKGYVMLPYKPFLLAALTLGSMISATSQAPRSASIAKPEVVGYFPQWGVYNRRYVPLDLIRSGAVGTHS